MFRNSVLSRDIGLYSGHPPMLLHLISKIMAAALFGGILFNVALFEPLSKALLTHVQARQFAAPAFMWHYLLVFALAALCGEILVLEDRVSGLIMFAVATCAIVLRQVLMPATCKDADAPRVARGYALSGAVTGVNLAQLILTGVVIARLA